MTLIYYPDSNPGIRRQRRGRGYSYLTPDGGRITDPAERARLTALAVPPAYIDVWMAPMPDAHLLATGRDARGRKQYRYHPDWTAARDQKKFDHLADVGHALPGLRRWIATNLRGRPGTRDTAVAAVLALIDRGAMRPGDLSYTAQNGSHGALTLEDRHLDTDGAQITLRYVAKGGAQVQKDLTGARLAQVLHRSADLPGPRLFDFRAGDGRMVPLRVEHLAETLRSIAGADVTPKSLRTWAGSHAAFEVARAAPNDVTITRMIDAAADRLHNTPKIARQNYVHPDVIALADGGATQAAALPDDGPAELRQGEAALLRLLA